MRETIKDIDNERGDKTIGKINPYGIQKLIAEELRSSYTFFTI
jgi:hypothetical protein